MNVPGGVEDRSTDDAELPGVVLFGAYPPPIGGNTVHIKRLLEGLQSHGVPTTVVDYLTRSVPDPAREVTYLNGSLRQRIASLRTLRDAWPKAVIHFHVSSMGRFRWVMPALLWLFRKHPLVMTVHSGGFVMENDRPGLRVWLRMMLKRFSTIVTVNREQAGFLIRLGADPDRVVVLPAFIPTRPGRAELPGDLKTRLKSKPVVVTSGYATPLYDYDVLIDCAADPAFAHWTFVFAFYGDTDLEYRNHIVARIEELDNATVAMGLSPEQFNALLGASDAYVRTTKSDGDAVAIREALDLGLVVFATDCVGRPKGCRVFPTSDSGALGRELGRWDPSGPQAPIVPQPDVVTALLDIYRRSVRVAHP